MPELKTNEALLNALHLAARQTMSADQLQKQRLSFIVGSLGRTSTVTKEQVQKVLDEHEGESDSMIVFELVGREDHEVYQELEVANGNRQYDFLRSIVMASLKIGKPFLSQQIIMALNFHAIICLHTAAGEYRPCPVKVGVDYRPPDHYRVPALMEDFVNTVNRMWEKTDAVVLASFVLWRLNHIHPFINGNGRTARAASYFVLCLKAGGWLPGETILPELLRQNRDEYVVALKAADASTQAGALDLTQLHDLLSRLLTQQLPPQPDLSAANNPSAPN